MSNTMKSFACFVAGIALIVIVVPVVPIQYVWAQNGSGPQKRYKITQKYEQIPKDITCNRNISASGCHSHVTFLYENGECETDPESYYCYESQEIKHRTIPVNYVDEGLAWKKTQIQTIGYLACTAVSMVSGCLSGAVAGAVGLPTTGPCAPAVACGCGYCVALATNVTCDQIVQAIKGALDPCCYGSCSADHTGPGVHGPMKTDCFIYQ